MELYTDKEVQALHEIALAIHRAEGLQEMCDRTLALLPELIFHEKSFFTYVPLGTRGQETAIRSLNMTEREQQEYTRRFAPYDYTAWYLNQEDVDVYRDSDVVSGETMATSRIYREWVLPMGMRYLCGNVIRSGGRRYGDLTLMRAREHGDFTDRELRLLALVTDHMRLWFTRHYETAALPLDAVPLEGLTAREREIAALACSELSLREISDRLSISYATARRHLANVYEKLGVSSRVQLMGLLRRSGKGE